MVLKIKSVLSRFAPRVFPKEKTKKNDQKAKKKGKKKAHFLGLSSSFVKVFDNKKFDSCGKAKKNGHLLRKANSK
ncbi:hypothetical protein [Brumimicrobium aurantiacum]|uniref:Uncharacterized protein n=1 Tax=Brumimicrobium aurantiacum TaxID=1737063 RepID=A0A3E1EUD0_9FLAO|nr:hypothetical protein [Brumimicrobium aurantiacum]RFC53138.1 hypothetical protein DXU93_14700 [Brumimicrobium aurantiacum]